MLAHRPKSVEPPLGLDALWHKAAGFARSLVCNRSRLLAQAEWIVSMEKQLRHLSDRRLRETISPLQDRFRRGRDTPEDRHLAFAVIREVAGRQVGLQPYPVQIAGALANTLNQSLAADVMKERTVALDEMLRCLWPNVTLRAIVHGDSVLCGPVDDLQHPRFVTDVLEVLENPSVKLRVPIKCGVSRVSTTSWADCSE